MNSPVAIQNSLQLTVENIGGIEHAEHTIQPGVTVLEGKNATNRTSFLQAIMAAMGSDRFSLKADADEGHVAVDTGDTVVERSFDRRHGRVESSGDGLLDDPALADLFAFLLEDNEARQTIMRQGDLRELIMRPVDTTAIEAEIERLKSEKQQLTEEIDSIDERKTELVDLERREKTLQEELETKKDELATKEAEIEEADPSLAGARGETDELESKLESLNEARSELEELRFDLETLREVLEALRSEREEKAAQLRDVEDGNTADLETLEADVAELRERKRRLDTQVGQLQSVIEFNEEMLDGTDDEIASLIRGEQSGDSSSVTDQLVPENETVVCWTCGSETERSAIENTLERLREARSEKMTERESVQSSITETQGQISELEERRAERADIESRIEEIDREIDERESRQEELEERREQLSETVSRLEAEVEETDATEYSELLDLHREANQLEFAIEQTEDELADVRAEIADIEERLDERADHVERRQEVQEELADLRTKIDDIERNAVEAFNTHMEEVLDILDYDNLARIWVERVETEAREGRRKVTRTAFELHVVRQTESDTAYEDTIAHLSESEREVTGLVFALAGYLVHDLHEHVPVMVLDSLEAIDSDRIARLVEYFSSYATFLVVALLPEDAAAIDDDVTRIPQI